MPLLRGRGLWGMRGCVGGGLLASPDDVVNEGCPVFSKSSCFADQAKICTIVTSLYPPSPLKSPIRCFNMFAGEHLLWKFVLILYHTRHCTALPSLQVNHLHVFCDILSPKAVCGVLCCFFRPKVFSPGDHVWYPPPPPVSNECCVQ